MPVNATPHRAWRWLALAWLALLLALAVQQALQWRQQAPIEDRKSVV